LIKFYSSFFEVSPDKINEIKVKHCDNCTICNGRRYNTIPEGVKKCQCLDAYNDEYNLWAANIPEVYHSNKEISKEFLAVEENKIFATRYIHYLKHLQEARDLGLGLYIQGSGGSGKSFFAAGILKKAIEHGFSVYFISVRKLIQAAFAANNDTWVKKDFQMLATSIDFLVVDDIDESEVTGNSTVQILLNSFFKDRYYAKVPLIVTTNHAKDAISEFIGEQISATFDERLSVLQFHGNYRPYILSNLEDKFFGDLY